MSGVPSPVPSGTAGDATRADGDATARRLYDGYCRRQASALLSLIPRDGIRPLYRTARDSAGSEGARLDQDPLEILNRFCMRLLPLPPFEVWREDFESHPDAHLDDMREDPALGAHAPLAVEIRSLDHASRDWLAELNVFPDGEIWRGFIEFRDEARASLRTADIFRDPSPVEIRRRFRSFESDTLRAFLRSTLP